MGCHTQIDTAAICHWISSIFFNKSLGRGEVTKKERLKELITCQ